MLSTIAFEFALLIRKLSIWAYRASELPERVLAFIAVCAVCVVTLVIWPPHFSEAGSDIASEDGVK